MVENLDCCVTCDCLHCDEKKCDHERGLFGFMDSNLSVCGQGGMT